MFLISYMYRIKHTKRKIDRRRRGRKGLVSKREEVVREKQKRERGVEGGEQRERGVGRGRITEREGGGEREGNREREGIRERE
jgi:hypothetical protein